MAARDNEFDVFTNDNKKRKEEMAVIKQKNGLEEKVKVKDHMNLKLPQDLQEQLRAYAKSVDRSPSSVIRDLIKKYCIIESA